MNELKIFKEIAENPLQYIKNWKNKTGKKVIGYFCSYTPEELIYAADVLPFRIFSSTDNRQLSDRHLQAYCCSMVKGSLEHALNGNFDFLEGTVFPHTCDSIQRLSDIWRLNAGINLHFDIILPVKLNTESSQEYLLNVFKKFKKDIESGLNIEISEEKLKRSISLYNKIRRSLTELYELKNRYPGIISGRDLYAIIKSSTIMERESFLKSVLKVINSLKKKSRVVDSSVKRILLAGGVCEHPDIYELLENMNASVVWDDLCTGTRSFEGEIDESKEPIQGIADRYINRPLCPTKHSGIYKRGDHLIKLVKKYNIQGVIFLHLKFCDPHSFDYPYLKEYLNREHIPNMLLEIENQLPSEGQVKTRLETFIEMIKL